MGERGGGRGGVFRMVIHLSVGHGIDDGEGAAGIGPAVEADADFSAGEFGDVMGTELVQGRSFAGGGSDVIEEVGATDIPPEVTVSDLEVRAMGRVVWVLGEAVLGGLHDLEGFGEAELDGIVGSAD